MSQVKWTQSQKTAIEIEKSSILVSAAAGSGKTAVLVERIMKNITDERMPSDINQFLISTFTKAAADEMREKIANKLLELSVMQPKNKHLKKQIALIYDADINTVHGICADLIRKNFSVLNIAPNFSLCPEDSASLIKKQIVGETLEEFYNSQENENFILALEMFWVKRDDMAFSNIVLSLYEKIIALPFYDQWLEFCKNQYDIDPDIDLFLTKIGQIIKEESQKLFSAYLKNYNSLKDEIFKDETYNNVFFEELDFINKCLNSNLSFDQIQKVIGEFKFSTLPRAKKHSDPILATKYKRLREAFKSEIKSRTEQFFKGNSKYYLEDIIALKPVIDGLFSVIYKFSENYRKYKNDKNLLDFSDLEHLALKLLITYEDGIYKKTDAAKKLSLKYKEIFIDEYQDTNGIQELIFYALSKGESENLFMVGDIKQSIYRFRQADPTIFLNKYNSFSSDLENKQNKKILLSKNFRSRSATLDAINIIFENVMNEYVGEINYSKDEFLYKNELYPNEGNNNYNPELVILDYSNISDEQQAEEAQSQDDNPKDELSKLQKEAVFVAKRIKKMLAEGFLIFDAKSGIQKQIEYKDIAILLRSTSGKDKIFEDVLKQYDIPVLCNTKSEYFQNSDVLLMLSLLKVIDNCRQDIDLLSVMRSAVFSFSEDEILNLRLKYTDGDIFDMVSNAAKEGNEKCAFMLSFIYEARKKAQNMAVYELIMYIYEASGYLMMIRGSKNSSSRRANLNTLYRLARDYEQTQYKGIFNFINYVNNLIENKNDITVIKNDLDSLNSVKIMSIHKSKGLEFGVVFVCDCAKQFNKADLRQSVVFHKDLGIGTDFKDLNRMIYYPTIAKNVIANKMNLELLSEELRILYVALTRAKEKLIIVGSIKDTEKTFDKILGYADADKKIQPYFSSMAKSHLDFIIMGLGIYKLGGLEYEKKYNIQTLDNSNLDLYVVDGNALKVDITTTKEKRVIDQTLECDNPYDELLEKRFNFDYKFEKFKNIPIKISVTELKGKVLDDELDNNVEKTKRSTLKKPKFIENQEGLSYAQRGSAMHMFMQFMDFERAESIEQIKLQANEMTALNKITKEQADVIDYNKIKAFFDSILSKRMKNSKAVYREQRFNLGIEANRFFETGGIDHEKMLIQGVIDCFFIEDEKAVLVDFKTDRIDKENIDEFKKRYALQLEIYKEAIEKIYGFKVKDKIIYSFYLNEAIVI